jgi:hypothetical protein
MDGVRTADLERAGDLSKARATCSRLSIAKPKSFLKKGRTNENICWVEKSQQGVFAREERSGHPLGRVHAPVAKFALGEKKSPSNANVRSK